MPFGFASLAVSAYGAYSQDKAGKAGAKAQQKAADAATAEQGRQFDITQQNLQPFLAAGTNALGQQQAYLNGDTSGFENSADYRFAVDQGFKGLDAGAAARGNLFGGGTDADRISLGQGLATQYGNNYYNKLAGLSNTGQSTANTLGQYGQAYAGQVGQNLQTGAQARASSYANTANAYGNFANQLASGIGQYSQGGNGSGSNYFGWGGV